MKFSSKIGTTVAATAAFVVLASPALAMSAPGTNVYKVSSRAGNVTGVCTFVSDVPDQSFANMTIALKYEVAADQPAYAVSGVCTIKDAAGKAYGSISAGMVGSFATNAGTVVVPRGIVGAQACNTPEALWLDGTEANTKNLTHCVKL